MLRYLDEREMDNSTPVSHKSETPGPSVGVHQELFANLNPEFDESILGFYAFPFL